jgi:hypothetical protein
MKFKSTLAASLFAIAAVLSFNASAVSDTPAETKTEKPDAMKKIRPHNRLEEQLGITAKTPEGMAAGILGPAGAVAHPTSSSMSAAAMAKRNGMSNMMFSIKN